ncbi:hypothetical protein ACFL4F_01060 [Candidatus Margulisiibacteriota bacterium]
MFDLIKKIPLIVLIGQWIPTTLLLFLFISSNWSMFIELFPLIENPPIFIMMFLIVSIALVFLLPFYILIVSACFELLYWLIYNILSKIKGFKEFSKKAKKANKKIINPLPRVSAMVYSYFIDMLLPIGYAWYSIIQYRNILTLIFCFFLLYGFAYYCAHPDVHNK